jgi:hypothetical protein
MSENEIKVSDAAFEIERLFRSYAEAGKTFQPDELAHFAAFMALMGHVARSMEENLRAYREGAWSADIALAARMAEAVNAPNSNVVLFPVVRRENFGGAA